MEHLTPQESLISFLLQEGSYPHRCDPIRHIETHISHIFLTGPFAYKMKKPLNLGFLDFSSLEKRRHFCERELELNRRYAPDLYCQVIPVREAGGRYSLGGSGAPVEYLIQMRQFDEEKLFLRMLEGGTLRRDHIVALTDEVVRFHATAERTPSAWSVETVRRLLQDNFAALSSTLNIGGTDLLDQVQKGQLEILARHEPLIRSRQSSAVKQLHGDLHLGNICMYLGRPSLFDGLEFNDQYSCCDVWADFAFLFMDLLYRGRADFAYAALNRYLERGDDFDGLMLLPLYASYRATVRAKIAAIAAAEGLEANRKTAEAACYLELSAQLLRAAEPRVMAIGGLSGSGKSTLAQALAEACGAVVIRSDAVRKHLVGIALDEKAPKSAYVAAFSASTYAGLRERCERALEAGFSVFLDAVFLSLHERRAVEDLARRRHVRFDGLWCEVSPACARARIRARTKDVSDADEQVLEQQEQRPIGDNGWRRVSTEDALPQVIARVRSDLQMT